MIVVAAGEQAHDAEHERLLHARKDNTRDSRESTHR
jgi:hypothetical protein